jgi:hypothetical protein
VFTHLRVSVLAVLVVALLGGWGADDSEEGSGGAVAEAVAEQLG